jgi:predicted TPR repeat methyltransferase
MRLLRSLLALAVVIVAGIAVVRVPWALQRCNIEKRHAEQLIDRSQTIVSDFDRQRVAAEETARLERCAVACPADWQVHFLMATLHQIAGREPAALHSYELALALEQRPEIYYGMSLIQLENGQAAEGLANAEQAARFNLQFADLYEKQLRDELWVKGLAHERLLIQKAQAGR